MLTPLQTISRSLRAAALPLLGAVCLGFTPANDPVPFSAAFVTTFTSELNFPFVHVTVVGSGKALHMGRTTAATDNQMVNVITGAATATYDLTAANGDVLTVELDAATTFLPNGVAYSGSYEITGGTGRFANATGTGTIVGTATNTGPTSGVGTFMLNGNLSR